MIWLFSVSEEVSVWFVNVLRDFSLSQVSLWLLCSHLAKRSKLSGREHSRVPNNSKRTRCENALNHPDASSGVVLSISAFPSHGWLAYLISLYYWRQFTLTGVLCCATLPSAGTRGYLNTQPFVSSLLCSERLNDILVWMLLALQLTALYVALSLIPAA